MIREIFSDVNPNTRLRKIAAIILYLFFMLCIIYTNNKKTSTHIPNAEPMGVVGK